MSVQLVLWPVVQQIDKNLSIVEWALQRHASCDFAAAAAAAAIVRALLLRQVELKCTRRCFAGLSQRCSPESYQQQQQQNCDVKVTDVVCRCCRDVPA